MRLFVSTSIVLCCAVAWPSAGFQLSKRRKNPPLLYAQSSSGVTNPCPVDNDNAMSDRLSRRAILVQSMGAVVASASLVTASTGLPSMVQANVGDLPEFANTNAILQGITVKVADPSQQKAMIQFLEDGFDCQVLRKRIVGSIEETWLGFGPEQLSIPTDFTLPVSSMAKYGGHATIHLVYDAKATTPLYTMGNFDGTRGGSVGGGSGNDNIAYLQMGVPSYRISQMVRHGGNILDAYAFVSVISPAGLPIRGIVGIAPDPIMLVAIHCANVKASRAFYEQLGFVEQDYPYCRPNKGMAQFEPVQPAKSVYLAPSPNCMGVLLLPSKKKVSVNPCIQSLNVVYNPSSSSATDSEQGAKLVDPSGVPISFQSVAAFQQEEAITR
jgi:hypothetical protein